MKIVCSKSELQRYVSIAAKAVAVKSPTYILEGMRIKAQNDEITIYGSDGILSIRCSLKADILEDGDIILPARLFCELLAKLEDCELIMFTEENDLVLECGHSRTMLRFMEPDTYPEFPEFDSKGGLVLFSNQLITMIDQTIFATSPSEEKPILTGILFEIEKENFNMIALDGYRLAIRRENIQSEFDDIEIVVPSKSMREIARIIPDDETPIRVFLKEKSVGFECMGIQFITRVLQGDYVRYKSILPKEYLTRVIVNRQSLLGSLERASILARQSKANLVNLMIEDGKMIITSDSEVGKAREEIDINMNGKSLNISFNSRYLLDVLKEVFDEEIVMDFNTNISPCVIHPISGDSFLYLVLPVKTN